MSNKQTLCANSRVAGCNQIVTKRGNILCDDCLEHKKDLMKDRMNNAVRELSEKNKLLSEELDNLRLYIQNMESKPTIQPEIVDLTDYTTELLRERDKLNEIISKLHLEKKQLLQEKYEYETTYNQLKLDKEEMIIEIERINKEKKTLIEQNEQLLEENSKLLAQLGK